MIILYTFLSAVILILIWYLVHNRYLNFAKRFYKTEGIFNLEEVNSQSPAQQRLMKLFFYRQQTLELSGYALLVICLIFLMCCIGIFVFANQIVLTTTPGIRVSDQNFWISTVALRAGILVIVFFICQVLLRLYRQCIKRAMFYVGLFDAMMLRNDFDTIENKALADMMMANADIDKEPDTQVDKILGIIGKK